MYQVQGALWVFMSCLDLKPARLSVSRLPESPQCSSPASYESTQPPLLELTLHPFKHESGLLSSSDRTHCAEATTHLSREQPVYSRPSGLKKGGPGQPTSAPWQCLSNTNPFFMLSFTICFFFSLHLHIHSMFLSTASDSGEVALPPQATYLVGVRIKMKRKENKTNKKQSLTSASLEGGEDFNQWGIQMTGQAWWTLLCQNPSFSWITWRCVK